MQSVGHISDHPIQKWQVISGDGGILMGDSAPGALHENQREASRFRRKWYPACCGGGLGEQQPACHDACSPAYTILIGLHSRKYPLNCYYISGWKPNFECFKWRTEVIQVGLLFHSTVSPLYTNPQVVNFQRCKHAFFQPQSVSLVAQSCPTLCNPMDCNTSGLPVHHQLLELA